jgi:hypothetical protein
MSEGDRHKHLGAKTTEGVPWLEPGRKLAAQLSPSCWRNCPESRGQAIRQWLLAKGLAPWPRERRQRFDVYADLDGLLSLGRGVPCATSLSIRLDVHSDMSWLWPPSRAARCNPTATHRRGTSREKIGLRSCRANALRDLAGLCGTGWYEGQVTHNQKVGGSDPAPLLKVPVSEPLTGISTCYAVLPPADPGRASSMRLPRVRAASACMPGSTCW